MAEQTRTHAEGLRYPSLELGRDGDHHQETSGESLKRGAGELKVTHGLSSLATTSCLFLIIFRTGNQK